MVARRILTILAALLLTATTAQAKREPASVFMFGFAASFNDTIVHFTEIQQVDSTWTDAKGKFLLGRDNYSLQLRQFLADQEQMPNRTCIVVYGLKREQVEKKLLKMRHLYTTPKNSKKNETSD